MKREIKIEAVTNLSSDIRTMLVKLLVDTVNDGASIGFISPLAEQTAEQYWNTVLDENTILLVAMYDGQICGTIQLQLGAKENALHRAEIAKLMVNPNMRRFGIGRALLREAEQVAINHNRTLIILDTREGDVSNQLYQSEHYIEAGKIPKFAKSSNGSYDATIFYYKFID